MHRSEPRFTALHALRVRGVASDEAVAVSLDGDVTATRTILAGLETEGLVKERTGRVSGWALTRPGRETHAEQLAADRSAGSLDTVLAAPYRRFLEVNQPYIDLVSTWQVRSDTGEANDHSDPDYDGPLLAGLDTIHEVGGAAATEAGEAVERFAHYRPRLDAALERVHSGDLEWFAKPTIDSYHTVWFQLHEDLLASQGIERGEGR